MKRRCYLIGRGRDNDIRLTDRTVSRRHAELVVTADGRYFLTDCGSTGGTHLLADSGWRPVRQAFVRQGDPLRFGACRTTVGELLARVPSGASGGTRAQQAPDARQEVPPGAFGGSDGGSRWSRTDSLPRGRVARNPETGEIQGVGDQTP